MKGTRIMLGVIGGAVVGAAIPVGTSEPPVLAPEVPHRHPDAVPARVADPLPPCPSDPPLDAADRTELEAKVRAFEEAWGEPPDPPAGFDPAVEEARLRAGLDVVDADLTAVSCELFPCVGLVASFAPLDRDAVAASLGIPAPSVALSEAAVDGETLHLAQIMAIDLEPLAQPSRTWSRRLRSRLLVEMLPQLEQVVPR
jgi:hypothetical protein